MERGLIVELSPNEEATLWRIAQGIVAHRDLKRSHVRRLVLLALIEADGDALILTDLGRRRVAKLTQRAANAEESASDPLVKGVAKVQQSEP